MPAALDIDREAVRMLVLAIGVRPAARELDIPEATVQAWSARFGWLEHVKPAPVVLPASMISATVATVTPADALQAVIAEHGTATRIGAVRYARKAVEHALSLEDADALEAAGNVKQAMQVLAIADGSGAAGTQVTNTVNILSQAIQL